MFDSLQWMLRVCMYFVHTNVCLVYIEGAYKGPTSSEWWTNQDRKKRKILENQDEDMCWVKNVNKTCNQKWCDVCVGDGCAEQSRKKNP